MRGRPSPVIMTPRTCHHALFHCGYNRAKSGTQDEGAIPQFPRLLLRVRPLTYPHHDLIHDLRTYSTNPPRSCSPKILLFPFHVSRSKFQVNSRPSPRRLCSLRSRISSFFSMSLNASSSPSRVQVQVKDRGQGKR